MKKIALLLLIIMLFGILSVTTYADEILVEDVALESTNDTVENTSFFARLWEFFQKYRAEAFTIIGNLTLLATAIYVKIRNGKGTKEINAILKAIKGETGTSIDNQNTLVDVVNQLIEAFNKMEEEYKLLRESYDKYGKTEVDRNKVIGALAVEITTVLEILKSVYVNNVNLPQGLKDLILTKYANCLKALESDEELASVVKAVRSAISSAQGAN